MNRQEFLDYSQRIKEAFQVKTNCLEYDLTISWPRADEYDDLRSRNSEGDAFLGLLEHLEESAIGNKKDCAYAVKLNYEKNRRPSKTNVNQTHVDSSMSAGAPEPKPTKQNKTTKQVQCRCGQWQDPKT